jgi:hypothetical protein
MSKPQLQHLTNEQLQNVIEYAERKQRERVTARLAQPDYVAKIAFRANEETEAEARERFRSEHGEKADIVITWKPYSNLVDTPPPDAEIEIPPRDDYAEPSPAIEEADGREVEGGVEAKDWARTHFERHPYGPPPWWKVIGNWN